MTGDGSPRYRRSPHLLVGWEGTDLVLTQCDSMRRFRVDDQLVAFLSRLDDWYSPAELALGGDAASAEVLDRMHEMGVVDREQAPAGAGLWNPFDLAVQRQQNVGGERDDLDRHGPPPAAFKDRPQARVTALPAPRPLDVRLDHALASRRSLRSYREGAMALADLSSLLHHSARVVETVEDEHLGQQAFHPYASAGARSELEVYAVANHLEGLERGAHWYDARAHELVLVRAADEGLDDINRWVSEATGGLSRPPQVILLVTAVFARIMWKYSGIGLSLIARDVGCLYQTLYLAATALGLAPCGIGAGPELANARWLGLDPLVESQVGCVLVGLKDGA